MSGDAEVIENNDNNDNRTELDVDFSLRDNYESTVQGVGPLSMSAELELETATELFLFVYGENHIKAVATPTDAFWTPPSPIDKKSIREFEQNKKTKVFYTKLDLPEFSSRFGCTLAVQGTECGQFYSTKVRTVVLDSTMCVFGLKSTNTLKVYSAVFQTMVSQFREDPTPRSWRVLLSHHAQLLVNGVLPNFSDGCLLVSSSFEPIFAEKSNTPGMFCFY